MLQITYSNRNYDDNKDDNNSDEPVKRVIHKSHNNIS